MRILSLVLAMSICFGVGTTAAFAAGQMKCPDAKNPKLLTQEGKPGKFVCCPNNATKGLPPTAQTGGKPTCYVPPTCDAGWVLDSTKNPPVCKQQ